MTNNSTGSYERPSKTDATALGHDNRLAYHAGLMRLADRVFSPIEMMLAQEKQERGNRYDWRGRAAWVNLRARIQHVAILEALQNRHLEATGKEISRSELLALLMISGIPGIIARPEFSSASDTAAQRQRSADGL